VTPSASRRPSSLMSDTAMNVAMAPASGVEEVSPPVRAQHVQWAVVGGMSQREEKSVMQHDAIVHHAGTHPQHLCVLASKMAQFIGVLRSTRRLDEARAWPPSVTTACTDPWERHHERSQHCDSVHSVFEKNRIKRILTTLKCSTFFTGRTSNRSSPIKTSLARILPRGP
jgi:hypothetical protein